MAKKNEWVSKITENFGVIASSLKTSDKESRILLPSPSFNWAIGGGIIEGKAVMFYGPESGGKSLLQLLTFIEIQKKHKDGLCMLFDAEYSFNRSWFEKLGGDPDRLIVRQSNDPEMIFDYMLGEFKQLLQDGAPIKCIGIDSMRAIVYPADVKETTTKVTMGGSGAKYLQPTLKRILPIIRENHITTVLVQQVGMQLDPMKAMVDPFTIAEGMGLKHFADYAIEITKIEAKSGAIFGELKDIKGNDLKVGHIIQARCKKNRTGAPYRLARFALSYEKGIINTENEVFSLGESLGVIFHPNGPTGKPNPQMYQFKEYPPIRTEKATKEWIKSDPKLQKQILDACDSVDDEILEKRNKAYAESLELAPEVDEVK